MKKKNILTTPMFWFYISILYFFVLLGVIWFYNPDFSQLQNVLWLLPLYGSVFFVFHLKYRNDMNITTFRLLVTLLLVAITSVLVFLGVLARYIK